MKVIQTELKNYNRRADESVTLRLDSLIELSSQDIADLDSARGNVAIVTITDSLIGNNIPDIDIQEILDSMPENDLYDNHKTPSQRLRNVLYVQYEQKLDRKRTNEEFADYYKRSMEAMINKIKATLEPNL